jgi:D-alanine transaminase
MTVRQVYINGEYVPAEAASISIFDRGFIFGDGVYEVIPVYGGRLFRLSHHLQRLHYSMSQIGIDPPLTDDAIVDVFDKLLADVREDASVYLQITRGAAPRNHAFPATMKPTVLAYAHSMRYPDRSQRTAGVSAITLPDQRWARCDIKSVSLLANVLARQQAHEQDAAEAILVRDGFLTEGAASTIFMVSAGKLLTPMNGHAILPGITRALVLELLSAAGIDYLETDITESQLRQADEIWLSSSSKEILPITRLDGQVVGDGLPGPLYERAIALYDDFKQRFRAGTAA